MDDIRFYGYKHWTLEDLPRCFNVGKGVENRPTNSLNRSHKWHGIVKRYGIRVEVCIGPVSNEEALQWEVDNVLFENTFSLNYDHDNVFDIGCNFTRGGEGGGMVGHRHSVKTREQMSKDRTGKRLGKDHPMFGKNHTIEARKLMGRSGEQNTNFGKKFSEETCQKLSLSHKGLPCPIKGKKFSEEARASFRAGWVKRRLRQQQVK